MSSPLPVSLYDAMTQVMRLVEPMAPPDRSAFLHALAQLLRSEPVQPSGDGIVHRHARQLLSTGHYKLASTFAVGRAQPPSTWRACGQPAATILCALRERRSWWRVAALLATLGTVVLPASAVEATVEARPVRSRGFYLGRPRKRVS
jgi:hypothetical protein